MMYRIVIHGRVKRFKSLDEAQRVAKAIFEATGIVVGIEKC